MILAVISGKGGTGKTTVATSLALSWTRRRSLVLADCDVEAPNARQYLARVSSGSSRAVTVLHPRVVADRCDLCGACAEFCRFGSLAVLPDQVIFIDSQCHACGGCRRACPRHAIEETPDRVGELSFAASRSLRFVEGTLDVGQSRATPVVDAVIEAALEESRRGGDLILDGPPGASCSVAAVAAVADLCLLVTEPTPFGLHDLEQVHELVRLRRKPAAVVLNRTHADAGDARVESWCEHRGLPIVLRVPDDRRVAEAYAAGKPPLAAVAEIAGLLDGLEKRLHGLLGAGTAGAAS